MKSRDHKIRRAEIKRRMRRMLRAVDRRWDALYRAFGAGVVLTVAGINFLLTSMPGHRIIWSIVFFLGLLFLVLYRALLRLFRDQGYIHVWLKPLDHIVIGVFFSISIFLQTKFNSEIALAGYLTAGVYGTLRLWKYSRPYWRACHFRVAREYLWEIDPDNRNNSYAADGRKNPTLRAIRLARPPLIHVSRARIMEKEELHFRCPLCGKKFSARNVAGHVKRAHPGMKTPQFISLLRKAEESGEQVVERKRAELKGVNASQKTAFNSGALATAKYVSVVPGGAVGLGKKR